MNKGRYLRRRELLGGSAFGILLSRLPLVGQESVIDLTLPVKNRSEPWTRRVPGSFGGSGGGPPTVKLPFRITVVGTNVKEVDRRGDFTIDIDLTNVGRYVIDLPVSREASDVLRDEVTERRLGYFFIKYLNPRQSTTDTNPGAATVGSPGVVGSLRLIAPGETMRLRIPGTHYGVSGLMSATQKELVFRVGYSEARLTDSEFMIAQTSEQVLSVNTWSLKWIS